MRILVPLMAPLVPNFIRFGFKPEDNQRFGFDVASDHNSLVVDVATLDDEELRAVGREWTKALIANATQRREPAAKKGKSK